MINTRQILLTDELYKYLLEHSIREHEVLRALREETYNESEQNFQSSPEQAQFMAFLIKLIGAKKVLEIGIFKGYSTLAFALSLPEDGKIIALESNEKWAEIAKFYWQKAGVAEKIDLRIGQALDSLKECAQESFDFIFIDADKKNYPNYYEACLKLLKIGGLMLIDNTLWHGRVIDLEYNDPQTIAIKELNLKLKDDSRIDLSLLPIRDGLTLVRKR